MKSKEALRLNNLTFEWVGASLDDISASLYNKKNYEKQIIPIEDNLVSDGIWNKKSQALSFSLDEKIVAVNTYYLVLSFPQRLESTLTSGKFIFSNGSDKTILSLNKR